MKAGLALDVGMGDCACMSFVLAAAGFDVIGIDTSSQAIHGARASAGKQTFKGSFIARRANAERMPFGDGEFDVVLAYRSLHHAKNVERVLHEMHRVCRAGGDLLIAELNDGGRRKFEHPLDDGALLLKIKKTLQSLGCSAKEVEMKHHTLFVSHKGPQSVLLEKQEVMDVVLVS
jgi:ubiquinone/menaquinone biosynthesis C-methylase UbiE